MRRYLLILRTMRRKPGTLIAIEQSILAAAIILRSSGMEEFHGYRIASEIKRKTDARLLTGHGTLYRALARLEQTGFLGSHWEDPVLAAKEGRPLRKLYKLTAAGTTAGEAAVAELRRSADSSAPLTPIREASC